MHIVHFTYLAHTGLSDAIDICMKKSIFLLPSSACAPVSNTLRARLVDDDCEKPVSLQECSAAQRKSILHYNNNYNFFASDVASSILSAFNCTEAWLHYSDLKRSIKCCSRVLLYNLPFNMLKILCAECTSFLIIILISFKRGWP